jgi:hydroxymethylpyrimidine pyrophosphatase-like HAD family hydrolase
MIIIPIGIQCTTAAFKNEIEKTHTFPFDWMFATPSFVFEMLELLLEKNINIEELVKNYFFCCEKRASYNHVEHYYTCHNGSALYNTKYNVIFPHDKYDNETINKYIRRFERLKDIILNSTECLYFIYTSQSSLENGNFTIDGNIVINDVYVYLSKIYKLISKFRNNYKIILFDTIQEENIELLDKNITLYKLNKCNSWGELLPQMRKYINFINK